MTATSIRARARDARAIVRYGAAAERAAAAEAHLDAALRAAGLDAMTVPGARVTRTPEGIAVQPLPKTNPDQLALWAEGNAA